MRYYQVVTPPKMRVLKGPLCAVWQSQYVKLVVEGLRMGSPVSLRVDRVPTKFQYTGEETPFGAEVMFKLGFSKGQAKSLEWVPDDKGTFASSLSRVELRSDRGAKVGGDNRVLGIPPLIIGATEVSGPFSSFGKFPLRSRIRCDFPFEYRTLLRTNDGPLFTDYEILYRFATNHEYRLKFRCYRSEPMVEVAERFSLGMNAELEMTLNPNLSLDQVLSHAPQDFEQERQPVLENLNLERLGDILCRLQMPPLGDYVIPNNRGWFALLGRQTKGREMLGLLALYGDRWINPVENLMKVLVAKGKAVLRGALSHGARYWLLRINPVEKRFTPRRRHVFHRLHAEFNALRLDQHLDLTEEEFYDSRCWSQSGVLGRNYREKAQENATHLPPLRRFLKEVSPSSTTVDGGDLNLALLLRVLLDPKPNLQQALLKEILNRFEKWVRDFQGYRKGEPDYGKNVIGFARKLRVLLVSYEMLRKDGFLADDQILRLNAYFVFAARRIMDEGRWPHSRTHLHPQHPNSTRDFYSYRGEHKPDRLIWTNSLPNFQSDPLCALLHISALIPEHPDAGAWKRKALDGLEEHLSAFCSRSGAWEESINYALFTLGYFIITFRIVKNRLGIDYFQDLRMRSFVGWLVRFFGPYDKRFEAYTFPGIGNAVLPQNQGEILLAYAGELAEGDTLREDLISVYQRTEPALTFSPNWYGPLLMAVMAPIPKRKEPLRPLASEVMEDLGVSFRHAHSSPQESYLFQKIGFWKDHYENDETSFNWYAKGTPLVMDYGTYSSDVSMAAAHNLVEVPDMDALRRGWLAATMFTERVDYSRCEVPITLKLLYGRPRSFEEIDGPHLPPIFFYLGDENPVGPKVWKTRLLLFVKPDYLVIFDRVFGTTSHRYNLHVTADSIRRSGSHIRAVGRFDLDLLCFVQHPAAFEFDTGALVPVSKLCGNHARSQRQRFFRLYNTMDAIYRTVLFAQERGRKVSLERTGSCGVKITTSEYTDYVFMNDEVVREESDSIKFVGRVGWIRKEASGKLVSCVPDGEMIEGFNLRIEGRGPWAYNEDNQGSVRVKGVPRRVNVTKN